MEETMWNRRVLTVLLVCVILSVSGFQFAAEKLRVDIPGETDASRTLVCLTEEYADWLPHFRDQYGRENVLLIPDGVNGIGLISDFLRRNAPVQRLILVDGGRAGHLRFGTAQVRGDVVTPDPLEWWGYFISPSGRIHLPGTSRFEGPEGEGLLARLTRATRSDWSSGGSLLTDPFADSVPRGSISSPRLARPQDGLNYVDLNNWTFYGGNSNWEVQPGGRTVFQSVNGYPAFFVTPDEHIDVIVQGTIHVNDTDNDWIGFVFGYHDPFSATNNGPYNFILFDWSRDAQWGSPSKYMGIYRVNAVAGGADLWSHTGMTVLTSSSNYGWQNNREYNFSILYMHDRVRVSIDGTNVLSATGNFAAGRFGFYNYSQKNVTYGNVKYAPGSSEEEPPVATSDNYGTNKGQSLSVDRFSGILANDYDPNLDDFSIVNVSSTNHGGLELNTEDGSFSYYPDQDFSGDDSFTYQLQDNDGLSQTATVTISVMEPNEAPTDISLSNASVVAHTAAGTSIGTFSTTDPNSGDTHDYMLINNGGGRFGLQGANLTVANADLLTTGSYTIRVRSTDLRGLYREEDFTITVTPDNQAPTGINLSSTAVAENEASGTVVGALSAEDPDSGDSHTFALVAGTGDSGNGSFAIAGNQLKTAASFDRESQASYSIRVRATDTEGGTFTRTFTITVNDVNEAPSIQAGAPVVVYAGETVILDGSLASATDPDDDDSALHMVVKTPPAHGTLLVDGSAIGGGGSFSQAQLAAGRVQFSHNGDAGVSDSFFLRAQDGEGLESDVVEIAVVVRPRIIVSGSIIRADGSGIGDVTLTVSGDAGSVVSNADGTYSVNLRYGWSGTITPAKRGNVFTPLNRSYVNLEQDQPEQDYLGGLESIRVSGRVTLDGNGLDGVSVALSDGSASAVTDSDGFWAVEVSWGWSGAIVPAKAGYIFTPSRRELPPVRQVMVDQDFSAVLQGVTVSGTILSGGEPLAGVAVNFSNGGGSVLTDGGGAYTATLPWGWSGTAVPVLAGYRFLPESREYVDLQSALSGQDYQAIPPLQVVIQGSLAQEKAWIVRRNYVSVTVSVLNREESGVRDESYVLIRTGADGSSLEVARISYSELLGMNGVIADMPEELPVTYRVEVVDAGGDMIAVSNSEIID